LGRAVLAILVVNSSLPTFLRHTTDVRKKHRMGGCAGNKISFADRALPKR